MGLLRKLFGWTATIGEKNRATIGEIRPATIGETRSICPYCSHDLGKMPGRKKNCPKCKKDIYVRSRPTDNAKILVREDEILAVEEQWAIKNGTHKNFLDAQQRRQTVVNALTKQSGHLPSANEVEWAILNDDILTHAKQMDWGLYRNARSSMAKILLIESKYEQALTFYLEVCYLDLNGPNNCAGERDPEIRKKYPPFNPKDGMLAPGIVGLMQQIVEKNEGQLTLSKERFIQVATLIHHALRLPLPPDKAWKKFQLGIKAVG